jgi:hypothetical protein
MNHPPDVLARLLVGAGCLMITAPLLLILFSCAVRVCP